MKKIICCFLCFFIIITFVSCKKADESLTTESSTVVETTKEKMLTESETVAPVQGVPQVGEISDNSTNEQIANYYNEVMLNSKNADKLRGTDSVEINEINIGFGSKKIIKSAIESAVNQVFNESHNKLLPVYGDSKIKLLADDIASFKVLDNGDSYILTIYPKDETNPPDRNSGPQSRFFDIFIGVESEINKINQLEYDGELNDHLSLNYSGGYGVITVDKETKQAIYANYYTVVNVVVTDVKAIVNIKNATAKATYITKYY